MSCLNPVEPRRTRGLVAAGAAVAVLAVALGLAGCAHRTTPGAAVLTAPASAPGLAASAPKAADAAPVPERLRPIVREALRRHRGEDPAGLPWDTLDRERLRVLLRDPAFAFIDGNAKEMLIDQAGEWDLLSFERPSELLAFWKSLFTDETWGEPRDPPTREQLGSARHSYISTGYYGIESLTTLTMMACYPSPAWSVWREDPMLWTLRQAAAWDQGEFGKCVHGLGRPHGPSIYGRHNLQTRAQVAARLADKLAHALLADGCTRSGPDACLPMLYALAALAPDDARWPAIVARVDADFGYGPTARPLPDSSAATVPPRVPTVPPGADWQPGQPLPPELGQPQRQAIYTGVRLRVLNASAHTWPGGDATAQLRATFDRALALERAYQRAIEVHPDWHRIQYLRPGERDFSNPWSLGTGGPHGALPASDALNRTAAEWGRDLARTPGCPSPPLPIGLSQASLAYALHKLAHEGSTCQALPRWMVASQYIAGDVGRIAPLKPWLLKAQRNARRARPNASLMAEWGDGRWICMPDGQTWRSTDRDPWGLCSGLRRP